MADWCNCSQEAAPGSGTFAAWCGGSESGSAEAEPELLQEQGKRHHHGQILLNHLKIKEVRVKNNVRSQLILTQPKGEPAF